MRSSNSLTKKEFLQENIFWAIAIFVWYKLLLFRNFGFYPRSHSLYILIAIIVVFDIIGIAAAFKTRRNYWTIFSNISIPLGIYAFLTYSKTLPSIWNTFVVVSGALCILYCFLVLRRKSKTPRRKLMKRRVYRCVLGVRTIMAFCMAAVIVPLMICVILGNSLIFSDVKAVPPKQNEEWTIDNNIDAVLRLKEETWSTLSTKERISTLQILANIEARYLGLPHELNVSLGTLTGETIAGYDDRSRTITINVDFLDTFSAREALEALAHEAYHAYQHRLCDAYDTVDEKFKTLLVFDSAEEYKREFSEYKDGKDDFDAYYDQACESKARAYSLSAVDNYYYRIDQYLTSSSQTDNKNKGE